MMADEVIELEVLDTGVVWVARKIQRLLEGLVERFYLFILFFFRVFKFEILCLFLNS